MEKIIMVSENGGELTERDVMESVVDFTETNTFREIFPNVVGLKLQQVREALYKYVIAVQTWEHPSTILDQIDEDDAEVILEVSA